MMISDVAYAYQSGALDEKYIDGFETKANSIIKSMSDKIDEFARYFRLVGDKKSFDPVKTVKETVAALLPILNENGIDVSIDGEDGASVFGFENALNRVLLEILNNILDIARARNIKEADIKISIFSVEDSIIIEISDNCGGIEDIEEIFCPYYLTKTTLNNVGLGLFAVKNILEENFAGTIVAKNGTLGAIFRLEIKKG